MYREENPDANVHFYRNFPAEEYARLINNSAVLVGNSSSALREGAYLGVPAVNVGTRQGGREHAANVCHADYEPGAIEQAARSQMDHGRYESSHMFGDGHAGVRIANLLADSEITVQKRLAYA